MSAAAELTVEVLLLLEQSRSFACTDSVAVAFAAMPTFVVVSVVTFDSAAVAVMTNVRIDLAKVGML